MKTRNMFSVLLMAVLVAGAVAFFGSAPAEGQCLSQAECDALKARLHDFRDDVKPLREQAWELRRQARDLPRGSDERKALRRQARKLKREFRQTRREHEVRRVFRAYRAGCRNC